MKILIIELNQATAIPMSTNEIGKHYDKLQIINMNARMYACPDEFSEIGNPGTQYLASLPPWTHLQTSTPFPGAPNAQAQRSGFGKQPQSR